MASCRIIDSPLTGKPIGSKTWSDIRNQIETPGNTGVSISVMKSPGDIRSFTIEQGLMNKDAQADALYGKLTDKSFRDWFGDWINKPGDKSVSSQVNEIGEPKIVSNLLYQINTSQKLEAADKQLDQYLLDYLKPFGVKSKEFNELKSRLGIDALGATDTLNKLIWLSKNRNIETVPEEFGHMITMLMGENNPLIQDLMSEIVLWDEYYQIRDQYLPIYKNEKQVKIEAIGKLLAKSLVKNYKAVGTNKTLIAKALAILEKFFKRFISVFNVQDSALYPMKIADKIALRILAGESLIDTSIKKNYTQLDFQQTLDAEPFAKSIVQKFTTGDYTGFKLTGSIALATQGPMYRDKDEKIHDLDFMAYGNDDKFEKLVEEIEAMGGIPIHSGWKHTHYVTYAFLIPKNGKKITGVTRDTNGWLKNYLIDGKNPSKKEKDAIAVDFFWSKEKQKNVSEGSLSSFSDVFAGKLFLSPVNEKERMFQREKDQKDYILFKPSYLGKSDSAFIYYQLPESNNTSATKITDSLLREKYFGNSDQTTSKEILSKIAASNHVLAGLAKRLMVYTNTFNVPIHLKPVDHLKGVNDLRANGLYYHEGYIEIAEFGKFSGNQSEATILHEIIHAYTVDFIRNNPNHPIIKDMNIMLEYLKENQSGISDRYGLTNTLEFITAVFTNASFIKDLQSIPSTKKIGEYKNLWEEFLEILGRIFKLNKEGVYNQILGLMTNVMEEAVVYKNITNTTYYDLEGDIYEDGDMSSGSLANGYQEQYNNFIKKNNLIPVRKDGINGYSMTLVGAKRLYKQYKNSGYLYDTLDLRYNITSGILEIGPKMVASEEAGEEAIPMDLMDGYDEDNTGIGGLPEDIISIDLIPVVLSPEEIKEKKKSLKEFKLNMVSKQITELNAIKSNDKITGAQTETIDKLLTNLTGYHKLIAKDEHTISMSKFTGGGELKNAHLYKDFTEFGTFIHHIIESLQNEAIETGSSPLRLMTPEKFKQLLEAYSKLPGKNAFNIFGLVNIVNKTDPNLITMQTVTNDLYDMAHEMVGIVQGYSTRGYLIIPEVNLVAKNNYGVNIVSRLDMMAIDKNGNVEIIDFKTKKITGTNPEIGLNIPRQVLASAYTSDIFVNEYHTDYDKWDIQLGIYQNTLIQSGINVNKKTIIALLYNGIREQEASSEFNEEGISLWTYRGYSFLTYDSAEDNTTSLINEFRYNHNMEKVNQAIPVETGKEDETKEKKHSNDFIFNLTEDEQKSLLIKLEELNAIELSAALDTINKLKNEDVNHPELPYWTARRESLRQVGEALKQDRWQSLHKIGLAVQFLDENMQLLTDESKHVIAITDKGIRADKLKKLVATSQGFSYFTNELKDLLLKSNVPENSKANAALDRIENSAKRINAIYLEQAAISAIELLENDKTETQVTRLDKESKGSKQPIIDHLKKKLENLKKTGAVNSTGYSIFTKFTNVIGSVFNMPENTKTEIENLELQITKLELEMKGVKKSTDEIRTYLNALLDPKSVSYIGETSTALTQMTASVSSSDPLLSAFTSKLKQPENEGKQSFVNFMERHKIGQEFENFAKGRSGTEVSATISEIRKILKYDENDVIVEKDTEVLGFINPIMEEFYNVSKVFRRDVRIIEKQIKEIPETEKSKLQLLRDQKTALLKEYRLWRIANTHMEYVDEIYELDKVLPEEYIQERDKLYKEKRDLEESVGFNNMDTLDDDVLLAIDAIEVQISTLRLNVIKQNANYQQYLDKRDEYFTYETNLNFYNRLKNAKIAELTDENGKLDEVRMKKWLDYNSSLVPEQTWFEERTALYNQIIDIVGSIQEVQDLKESQRLILNQYKHKGHVDTRFLTDQDIENMAVLDEMIEEAKSGRTKLQADQKDKLKELFEELNELQRSELNPFYKKEFDTKYRSLDQKWNMYQKEINKDVQSQEDIDRALQQYLIEEGIFTTWYNKNHTNVYESRINPVANPINPLPKKFNFIYVPVNKKRLKRVPNAKFTTKVVKSNGVNPVYQEDQLGYAMPKGLTKMNTTNGTDIQGDSPWLNDAYRKLRTEPEKFAFYKSFVGRFQDMQSQTTGKNLGFAFPGYEQKSLEDIKAKGIAKGIANRWEIMKEKNFKVGGVYDYVEGYGDQKIRFMFNRPLPIAQQTTDGISAVTMWYNEALINIAIAKAKPEADSIIAYVEKMIVDLTNSKNIPNKEQRLIGAQRILDNMKFEYDKNVKGQSKKDEGSAGKMVDTLMKFLGVTRMGFDIPNQIGNLLSGNVQAFLGTHKSDLYGIKNYLYSKRMIEGKDGLIGNMIKDSGKISGKSFITKMFYYMNPLQESIAENYDKTRNQGQRLAQGAASGEFLLWVQDKGEMEIAASVWFAVYDNIRVKVIESRDSQGKPVFKLDKDGNPVTVNAYEAYTENANGEIVIRDDVQWDKKEESAAMRSVWDEIRRTQGNYAGADKTRMEYGAAGRLLYFYRKYLLPNILNRFGRLQNDHEAGRQVMGTYSGLLAALKYYGPKKVLMSILGKENEVDPFYSRKSVAATREILIGAMMYILATILLGLKKQWDDDDDKITVSKIAFYNMLAIYLKVDNETRSLIPTPIFGGIDNYITNLGSFTNANRDILKVTKLLEHSLGLVASTVSDAEAVEKMAYYQKDSGNFDAGEAKIKKDIMDLTGYMNVYEIFNPKSRVDDTFKRR